MTKNEECAGDSEEESPIHGEGEPTIHEANETDVVQDEVNHESVSRVVRGKIGKPST